MGLRCSGKTTLGARLAEHLALPFVDLDQGFEPSAGACLRELGESAFRDIETELLRSALSGARACVVATGGGVVTRPENRQLLRESARCLWLHAPLPTLVQRWGADTQERPALRSMAAEDELMALALERNEHYAAVSEADFDTSADADMLLARLLAYLAD